MTEEDALALIPIIEGAMKTCERQHVLSYNELNAAILDAKGKVQS